MCQDYVFEGIKGSPIEGYRNKMEFSLVMSTRTDHWRWECTRGAASHDVVNVDHCKIVHEDFNEDPDRHQRVFLREKKVPFYKKLKHEGFCAICWCAASWKTGEILVALGDFHSDSEGLNRERRNVDPGDGRRHCLGLTWKAPYAGILQIHNDVP